MGHSYMGPISIGQNYTCHDHTGPISMVIATEAITIIGHDYVCHSHIGHSCVDSNDSGHYHEGYSHIGRTHAVPQKKIRSHRWAWCQACQQQVRVFFRNKQGLSRTLCRANNYAGHDYSGHNYVDLNYTGHNHVCSHVPLALWPRWWLTCPCCMQATRSAMPA